MDSYRVEKLVTIKIALPDADSEIGPVPTDGGGRKPEPEMDYLSNIIKTFNDQFGDIDWKTETRSEKLSQKRFLPWSLPTRRTRTP